jgi:hypothetical protein
VSTSDSLGDREWRPFNKKLQGWFEEYESERGCSTEPRPTEAHWDALEQSLRIRFNRQKNLGGLEKAKLKKRQAELAKAENQELDAAGGLPDFDRLFNIGAFRQREELFPSFLKDVDYQELLDWEFKPIAERAGDILPSIAKLTTDAEAFENKWGILRNGVTATEIRSLNIYAMPMLHAIGADPERPVPERPGPGRPRDETRRPIAKQFDSELRAMLDGIGYGGPTASLAKFIGRKVMNRVYGLAIRPGGYAQALSDRDRTGKQPKPKKRAKSARKER